MARSACERMDASECNGRHTLEEMQVGRFSCLVRQTKQSTFRGRAFELV